MRTQSDKCSRVVSEALLFKATNVEDKERLRNWEREQRNKTSDHKMGLRIGFWNPKVCIKGVLANW